MPKTDIAGLPVGTRTDCPAPLNRVVMGTLKNGGSC